jgi:hypothetical protein
MKGAIFKPQREAALQAAAQKKGEFARCSSIICNP